MLTRSACTALAALSLLAGGCNRGARAEAVDAGQAYQYPETRALVAQVNDAAKQVQTRGEAALADFRVPGSRWRRGERYVFVLDPEGDMLVHPDPALEGKNVLGLTDVNGKPIIRGLIAAATELPGKPEGWYHYEWPVPGELLPRWKSSYVRLVVAPSGKRYVVGSGIYDNRMERSFVVDLVKDAVGRLERQGESIFPLFHDPKGPFIAKDAYVFVVDPRGALLVNPAFPNLEGRNMLDVKDTRGKPLFREMLEVARTRGAGWVDYMWPKPGESVSTQKSTYVMRANLGNRWLVVGCGVYLPGAPTAPTVTRITAPELMALVHDGAAVLEKEGPKAFPEFRRKGSKWFRDDTYFFVWSADGKRIFHAADPALEGTNGSRITDILGRPYGRMFLEIARSPSGQGWVHYMYPQPGTMFPTWKSTFLERVTFPSGERYLLGSGAYNMQMDPSMIEDVVDRAAALVEERGRDAFAELRDKKGPFVFMDTYVFVDLPDGTELVNGAQPSLEGRNLSSLKDLQGRAVAREYITLAMRQGSGWVAYDWYKPGTNTPAPKRAFVRKVEAGGRTYIVGSGFYPESPSDARGP